MIVLSCFVVSRTLITQSTIPSMESTMYLQIVHAQVDRLHGHTPFLQKCLPLESIRCDPFPCHEQMSCQDFHQHDPCFQLLHSLFIINFNIHNSLYYFLSALAAVLKPFSRSSMRSSSDPIPMII